MPNETRDLAIVYFVAVLLIGTTVHVWAGPEGEEGVSPVSTLSLVPMLESTPLPTPMLLPLPTPSGLFLSPTWSSGILQWSEPIFTAASVHGLNPNLIAAVIMVESGGNAEASGRSGEHGLMQIMPYHSCASWDPALNIDCGTQILSRLIERAGGSISLGLAAYNAGETGRDRDGKGLSYANTVLALYRKAKETGSGQE